MSKKNNRNRKKPRPPTRPRSISTDPPPGTAPSLAVERGRPPRLARGSEDHRLEITRPPLAFLRDVEPQSLGISYWFDAAQTGEPYSVNVRLAGKRLGDTPAGGKDAFTVMGTVERVLPGSGRVVLTVRVPDLPPGDWEVTSTPVKPASSRSPAQWSPLRDPPLPAATASGTTTFTTLANQIAPGTRLGAWSILVATGAVLALVIQSLLAHRLGLPVARLLPLSILACVLGLVGAKAYYVATHRSEPAQMLRAGKSIQGFVIAAVGTLLAGALLLGLPLAAALDATTPGILVGMAVGRLGCVLAGCCVGRPTVSRWGIWSSNQRVGVRRIPVQVMESTMAAALAVLAVSAVLAWGTASNGAVFLSGLGAYTAGRQLLFPLREMPRSTAYGRSITLFLSAAAALGALVVAITR